MVCPDIYLQGLILKDSSITLPKEPVTQPGEIVFGVTVSNTGDTECLKKHVAFLDSHKNSIFSSPEPKAHKVSL